MSKAPDPPQLPAAPEFKNSMIYDSEGNLSGSITKDAQGNIVYKPRELTGAERVQKAAIESTRQSLLQRLYNTPEEYTKAAQAEADAFAKEQGRVAQEGFERDTSRIGEVSNVRGLLGSSAWRDIQKEREKTQAQTQASIASNAMAMREGLIQAKKGQDYNLYNLYSGAAGEYGAREAEGLRAAQGLYATQGQMDLSKYAQNVSAIQQNYANQMSQWGANEPWRNYIAPAAMTAALAFSDRRLKADIRPEYKVGDVQFYSFTYVLPPEAKNLGLTLPEGRHFGVMADEVKPLGVVIEGPFGYDMVDYEALRRHLKMEMS